MLSDHPHAIHSAGSRRFPNSGSAERPLHCIPRVLDERHIDIGAAAQQMNIAESQARTEARETSDLNLSCLYRWQAALEVPASRLLRPGDAAQCGPEQMSMDELRDRVFRALRTLRSLQVRINDDSAQSLSMILSQQLSDLLPRP